MSRVARSIPKLPLAPGFVPYSDGPATGYGAKRLYRADEPASRYGARSDRTGSGALVIHCLDIRQPVAAQLAAEEALFVRVIGGAPGNG